MLVWDIAVRSCVSLDPSRRFCSRVGRVIQELTTSMLLGLLGGFLIVGAYQDLSLWLRMVILLLRLCT